MTRKDQGSNPIPTWLIPSVVAGTVLAATAAAGAIAAALVSRSAVIPTERQADNVRIIAVDSAESTITISATPDTLLPGTYGFFFSHGGGHARLGEVLATRDGTVTRRIVSVDFGSLPSARSGRISGWVYLTPTSAGLECSSISIATALGQAPAWLIPAADIHSSRWVIHVHGRGSRRAEMLRAVPIFRSHGYHSLVISYRNDGDAPSSPDGRYALGETEWNDVESAIQLAIDHGATSIVLNGWSMGGSVVLQTAIRSAYRSVIKGIVLDSPVVNWDDTLLYRAREMRLPASVSKAALETISQPWGKAITGQARPIDLDRLNTVRHSDELVAPMLLLHSDDDGYVDSAPSHALAKARPDLVTFVPFTVARHVKLYNYDPERWNAAVSEWLRRVE